MGKTIVNTYHLEMVTIPPMKMVMTGGWFISVLPTLDRMKYYVYPDYRYLYSKCFHIMIKYFSKFRSRLISNIYTVYIYVYYSINIQIFLYNLVYMYNMYIYIYGTYTPFFLKTISIQWLSLSISFPKFTSLFGDDLQKFNGLFMMVTNFWRYLTFVTSYSIILKRKTWIKLMFNNPDLELWKTSLVECVGFFICHFCRI